MRKELTELVFILDCSGSMHGLEADTLGGFNSMLEKQREGEGDAYVSTVLFNNHSAIIHDRVNIKNVEPMTEKQYQVSGCTALLDAVGGAIHHEQEKYGWEFLFLGANIDAVSTARSIGIGEDRAEGLQ